MRFSDPWTLLWALLALPLMAFSAWRAGVAAERRRRLLGGLAERLAAGFHVGRRLLRDGLLALAVAAVVVALAGPLWGTHVKEYQERGVDVMVVLDTSRSMLSDDMRPSRLERAKREVRGLLDRLQGDRVGLVTFAGDARLICPLTHDATTLRLFLDDVDTTTNAFGGTAVGEGLEAALDAFDEEYPAESVIVLLTDGEDHASDPSPDEVAYEARARAIPVHVVSFGTAEGGTIPVRDSRGRTMLLRDDGEVVVTRPDEALLERIAGIAGGSFLSAERTPFPLDELYTKRIAVMSGIERSTTRREEGRDRFQWAVMVAIVCLGLREAIADGRTRP